MPQMVQIAPSLSQLQIIPSLCQEQPVFEIPPPTIGGFQMVWIKPSAFSLWTVFEIQSSRNYRGAVGGTDHAFGILGAACI